MKRLNRFWTLVPLWCLVASAGAADIKLMSQNQYFGANFRPLIAAEDAVEFNDAIVEVLQTVAASLPAERVKALAAIIEVEQPVLVGLQEMYRFQCTDLGAPVPGTGCSHASIAGAFTDHLQDTLDALDGSYAAVATMVGLDVPVLPFTIEGVPALLSATDRDVILARADVDAMPVDFTAFSGLGICSQPSGDGCNYAFVPAVVTPFGPVSIDRGYAAVDVTIDGKDFRLVNTHLEVHMVDAGNPLSPVFQAAQAMELLQVLLYTTPPDRALVVLGDFTCCQLGDLSNQQSVLYERVDLVFALEAPAGVKKARVVGAKVSDKTPPAGLGVWPSDHASVSLTLRY